MNGVLACARMLVLICVLGLLAVCAGSQELPGRVGGAGPGQLSFSANANPFGMSSDVFVGNDARGPYNLNWRNINRFSDSVTVDNRLMQRDSDYQIDYAAGNITFASSVSSKAVIRVEYSYDPEKATRNRAPLNMPLTLDIMKKDNRGLQFTALYRQPDAAAQAAPDVLVYGLTGATKAKQGSLDSMLLFSPDRPGETQNSDFGDRSAMKIGGTTKTDSLELTTSFLHVGEQFAGSKDYKLQQGLDAMNMAMVYTPNKSLLMSSSFNRIENSVGEKKGEALSTSEQKIVLTPDGAPKLTMTHSEIEKEKAGAVAQETLTDRIQLDQNLGSKVTAQAVHETVNANVGGSESTVSTNQLNLSAKPTDNMSVQGRLFQKDSSTAGGQTGMGLDIQAAPSKTMSLNVGVSRVDAEQTGESNAETLKLLANPNQRLSVEMKVAHKDTDLAGNEFSHALKVSSALRPDTKLEFGMSSRDVERPEDESAKALKLSTTALRNASIFLDWGQRESDVKGPEEFEGIRVETTPTKTITVGGGLSQRQTADARDLNKEASLQVQPFSHTTIGGAYKETESNGQVVARVSEVNATTKPSGLVQFAGAWKDRETISQDDVDSPNLSLQLDTGGLLTFTGAYVTNPEDKKGAILRQNNQSIGMKTDFGKLKLKGAYTLNDLYLAGTRGETKELGADLRLSANSLLTTGYCLNEQQDTSLMQTSVYSLGYTHNLGARMNLYLGGKMTTYEKDRITLSEPEYEAEARLGLKF